MSAIPAALEDQPAVQYRARHAAPPHTPHHTTHAAPPHTPQRASHTAPPHTPHHTTHAAAPHTPQRAAAAHRAPAAPINSALHGRRGRRTMTAALVAGISLAGVCAAAVTANQVQAAPLSRAQPAAPAASTTAPTIASGLAGVASVAVVEPPPEAKPTLSATRVRKRIRPAPVPVVTTAGWANPLPEGVTTSCFGQRWGRLHAGVDLAAPAGTGIRAAGAGVVAAAGVADGYGNAVLIDHGIGYLTHYGHMSVLTVLPGQNVAAGQQIGLAGSTGNSTGPHLHFEVHQGSYRNPIEPTGWLRERGVAVPGCPAPVVAAEPTV